MASVESYMPAPDNNYVPLPELDNKHNIREPDWKIYPYKGDFKFEPVPNMLPNFGQANHPIIVAKGQDNTGVNGMYAGYSPLIIDPYGYGPYLDLNSQNLSDLSNNVINLNSPEADSLLKYYKENVLPHYEVMPEINTVANQSADDKEMERRHKSLKRSKLINNFYKSLLADKKKSDDVKEDNVELNGDMNLSKIAPDAGEGKGQNNILLPEELKEKKMVQLKSLQNLSKLKAMIHVAKEERRSVQHKREEARRQFLSQVSDELQLMTSAKLAELKACQAYRALAKAEKALTNKDRDIHNLLEKEDVLYEELTNAEANLAKADMNFIPNIKSENDLRKFSSFFNFGF